MIRRVCRLLATLSLTLIGGCSPVQLLNSLISDDYRLQADQSYGIAPRQKLDIYRPRFTTGPSPVLIFFYGGNWQAGSKADYRFVGEAFAAKGFIVVIPDYRLYPEIRYPAFLDDGAAAVSWTLSHLAQLGGDPERLHLMGHSAGAYTAAMLALDGRWLGAQRTKIKSTVGLAGPYDFLPLTDPALQDIFSTEADLSRTQPITFADGSAAPMFLASGRKDDTVSPGNSQRLAERIRAHGGVAVEKYYDTGHVGLVAALARPLRFIAPLFTDVATFLGASN